MSRTIKNEEKYVQKHKAEKAKRKTTFLKFKNLENEVDLSLRKCPECGLQTCGDESLPYCNYCEWDMINEREAA